MKEQTDKELEEAFYEYLKEKKFDSNLQHFDLFIAGAKYILEKQSTPSEKEYKTVFIPTGKDTIFTVHTPPDDEGNFMKCKVERLENVFVSTTPSIVYETSIKENLIEAAIMFGATQMKANGYVDVKEEQDFIQSLTTIPIVSEKEIERDAKNLADVNQDKGSDFVNGLYQGYIIGRAESINLKKFNEKIKYWLNVHHAVVNNPKEEKLVSVFISDLNELYPPCRFKPHDSDKQSELTAQQFYEKARREGLTKDITSNPNPDYGQSFYQSIFRLMEEYAAQIKAPIVSEKEIDFREKYNQWCKLTKRNNGVLVGGDMYEFLDWLSQTTTPIVSKP